MAARVSTLSVTQSNLRDILSVQSNLATIQKQISSGKTSQSFEQLSEDGKIERIIGLETKLQKVENYLTGNTSTFDRMQAMNLSIEKIQGAASRLRDTIVSRRSSNGDAVPLDLVSKAELNVVKDNLNVNFAGRYLFAGSQTRNAPVGDIVKDTNYLNGAPTSNYYSGDNVVLTVRANDTLELSYGVTANESGFEKLIAAMHVAIDGHANDDDAKLQNALRLVGESLDEMSDTRARLNNNMNSLTQANENHEDFKLYLNDVVGQVTETDIAEAAIKASTNETILQATFQTFARLSRLTLSEYLR